MHLAGPTQDQHCAGSHVIQRVLLKNFLFFFPIAHPKLVLQYHPQTKIRNQTESVQFVRKIGVGPYSTFDLQPRRKQVEAGELLCSYSLKGLFCSSCVGQEPNSDKLEQAVFIEVASLLYSLNALYFRIGITISEGTWSDDCVCLCYVVFVMVFV